MGQIKTFGDVDPRSLEQLKRCMEAGDAEYGVLCADHHPGYSQPIGGAVAYEGYISPSGVGYDIGCIAAGARVTSTDLYAAPIETIRPDDVVMCIDGGSSRFVAPNLGAVPRGTAKVLQLELANGRELRLTPDHRVLTRRGWVETKELTEGDSVLCTPFVGCQREPFSIAPALLRVVAYVSGDGHLTRDGKTVSVYTTVDADALLLKRDFESLGYRVGISRRERGARRPEIQVRVHSTALHRELAELGSPVGRKTWSRHAWDWLFDAPKWVRAAVLSAFASAEMATPRLVGGCIANLAIKQRDTTAAHWVVELLTSMGFRASLAPSASCYVVQIVGGEDEQLRFLEEVGFCLAADKRAAAAACASVAWQRRAHLVRRRAATLQAQYLRARDEPHRAVVAQVATEFGVPRGFVHHSLYTARPLRRGLGTTFSPCVFGEGAWVPIDYVGDGGVAPVWDIATGDPAESFLAEGILVHNCGNKAAQTELTRRDLDALGGLEGVMREVTRRISFGMGVPAQERVDHPVLDKIRRADFAPQRQLADLAESQLGTVGSGNHYVNVMEDEAGHIWVGVHFGSRGFGHKTASGFLALAQGLPFEARGREGEMDSPPVLLEVESELGQSYIAAMDLALEYAYAGRDAVVDKVLEILGAEAVHEVHNNHNYAAREEHFGRAYWVVRKGCTPARPGQEGFVGGSMGDDSVILEGVESSENEEALFSTVHGAGRVMSRSQAAGRVRRQTVYQCSVRDCDFTVPVKGYAGQKCPDHPNAKMRKWRTEQVVRPGVVDWPAVQARLREQGIVLIGGGADEAPEVYKRLPDVLAAHEGTIRVKHILRPLGVAMAGRDVYDPYKD